ncbi:hypothetical protein FACS189496_1450 [Bacilli bacterium]|nr:hypothetical protein FACS189496_1450 [Bacilli bacterium]
MNCNFEYFQKGQAFCTDTSYFKTPFGMTYICGAIDLCDNEISGLKAS